ncbi:MAG TPA: 3-hydroxyacyl-CoA dehydrogenase family protein [Solirubrobacteraceae bacterium]|nr:3-hydroxyacyl-CoA dehydrogenase family protein [Solirubrobacteraceae bacterium]
MSASELPATAAVLGAGTIGMATGLLLAAHGVPVTIVTRRASAAEQLPDAIDRRVSRLLELGALSSERAESARAGIRASVGLPAGESFALIYEAVAEDLDIKRSVLANAERCLARDGVLTTGTSSLSVAELASALAVPERFAAWHWFHPADLMPLVEIVPGDATADDVTDGLRGWSAALGKRAIVLARDAPGFVANRLQYALLREGYALVEAGVCNPADVDLAVTAGLGPRWAAIGPFATMDLGGLDVHARVASALFGELSNTTATPKTLERLRADGAGGARDGRGLLGHYPPQRLPALEDRRDRYLVMLGGDDER